MPALALFAFSNLGHDMKALWGWLCHRSFWQLAFGAVAIYAVIQHFQIADARHDADNYMRQRDGYKAALDGISTKKNEQKTTTGKNIVIAERKVKDADEVAKKIEAAPLPGLCATPKEIMGAGL